ncbi:aldehyde dehydrogenase family protein [Segeticoccus rhizosphaerae]|uniref:aldehyde dehydrogenase family protein n=1 Tax=Segeticoccus rhizosphaerae TaxID=1104777 RepID=UPI0010C09C21|nr:aldehyde dehydrogenase family protein [Ornithinicoccus soli]
MRSAIYLDGSWQRPESPDAIPVFDPYTEASIGSVPECTPAEVGRAVAASRRAFASWSRTPLKERLDHLDAIAQGLRERAEEMARTISEELGAPIVDSRASQVGLSLTGFDGVVSVARGYAFEEEIGTSLVIREPMGVAACITPWNYPLHQITLKVASALAAGCTVVLKPSEVTPFNALLLTEIIDRAGLPPGVFNLVSGSGAGVGEALVSHPDVDLVSFTGSTRAGMRISELAAPQIKRLCLELGGKSAAIVLDDADLEIVVPQVLERCLTNAGQNCAALSRLLVPASAVERAANVAAEAAGAYTIGDPRDESVRLGPVVSSTQWDRVRGYVRAGMDSGARLVCGGIERPAALSHGYFVPPTVFSEVRPEMSIFREEIFGPVLGITGYESEDEAVALANDSDYGLSGAVWSADRDRAVGVARNLRTGQVTVNGGAYNFLAPFGGYKRSGLGRESGRYGLEEFLQVKSLQL